MKVLLIGNYEPDAQYSMQGFARALLDGFTARGLECRLITPPPVLGRGRSAQSGIGKWLGYADKFALFPRSLKHQAEWADVVHICDHGNASYVNELQRVPHLVTCHDMLAVRAALGQIPGWETGATGRIFQRIITRGLARAQSVVCVSEATRMDLLRMTTLTPEQTSVVYNGLYRPCPPMSAKESAPYLSRIGLETGQPFLLHVGGNQPYKNRLGVLKIYNALASRPEFEGWKMVMAGKPFSASMREYHSAQELGDRVLERSGLDNDSLRALYSRAQALVFPSLFEGFGLPVIEAQSCGCPVFASNRAPMTEAGGDAAVYFDPEDPLQAAETIAEGLTRAPEMRAAGFENARRFTTERMLDGYENAYWHVLGGTGKRELAGTTRL